MEYVKLNNGVNMPSVGIGTFLLEPGDAENSVREALKMGYRLVDTANAYVNERAVGRGIKSSLVSRKDVFISSKLWPSEYNNEHAVDDTLDRLGVDYIDLLFLHQPSGDYLSGYKLLEKAYKEGKVRAIGLSNFDGKYLDDILNSCEIKPQVMQVECHPYFEEDELRKITDPLDIKIMCWYPLGHGDRSLLDEDIIVNLSKKYGKSPAQIILRWHNQMGFIVIPGSKNVNHIRDNFDIFDFELTDSEMKEICSLNCGKRYYYSSIDKLEEYSRIKPKYEEE